MHKSRIATSDARLAIFVQRAAPLLVGMLAALGSAGCSGPSTQEPVSRNGDALDRCTLRPDVYQHAGHAHFRSQDGYDDNPDCAFLAGIREGGDDDWSLYPIEVQAVGYENEDQAKCTNTQVNAVLYADKSDTPFPISGKSAFGEWVDGRCKPPVVQFEPSEMEDTGPGNYHVSASATYFRPKGDHGVNIRVTSAVHNGLARYAASEQAQSAYGINYWVLWATVTNTFVMEGFSSDGHSVGYVSFAMKFSPVHQLPVAIVTYENLKTDEHASLAFSQQSLVGGLPRSIVPFFDVAKADLETANANGTGAGGGEGGPDGETRMVAAGWQSAFREYLSYVDALLGSTIYQAASTAVVTKVAGPAAGRAAGIFFVAYEGVKLLWWYNNYMTSHLNGHFELDCSERPCVRIFYGGGDGGSPHGASNETDHFIELPAFIIHAHGYCASGDCEDPNTPPPDEQPDDGEQTTGPRCIDGCSGPTVDTAVAPTVVVLETVNIFTEIGHGLEAAVEQIFNLDDAGTSAHGGCDPGQCGDSTGGGNDGQ
jgi:hypothetical protein